MAMGAQIPLDGAMMKDRVNTEFTVDTRGRDVQRSRWL